MRRAILLTSSNLIVSYFLFSTGLYLISSFILGDGVFDDLDDLKKSINETVWYVDFLVCPAIAVLVGLATGCLAERTPWKIALLSTLPIFAYLHVVDFPKLEASIIGEGIRGGRYILIGTMTALLVSRLKHRLLKRESTPPYDLPEYR